MLLWHIAARRDIEVIKGSGKEEVGLDQYKLMSATAIVRFRTLAMLAYVSLYRHVLTNLNAVQVQCGIFQLLFDASGFEQCSELEGTHQ